MSGPTADRTRVKWPAILDRAAVIVRSYDTSVTLRQLFYQLVSAQLLPNTDMSYKTLSARIAEARRDGRFPELVDATRTIVRDTCFDSPDDAMQALIQQYRTDRTEGQDTTVYLGVEKRGLVQQLSGWFGEQGFPILPLGGYCSQSHIYRVRDHVEAQRRDAVLLYAGDFDPSGEDIVRDFVARSDCWSKVVRVALTADQVDQYNLPRMPGKAKDSRNAGFVERHGALVQVEVDALSPTTLRGLFRSHVDNFWDTSAFEAVLEREAEERAQLTELRRQL